MPETADRSCVVALGRLLWLVMATRCGGLDPSRIALALASGGRILGVDAAGLGEGEARLQKQQSQQRGCAQCGALVAIPDWLHRVDRLHFCTQVRPRT